MAVLDSEMAGMWFDAVGSCRSKIKYCVFDDCTAGLPLWHHTWSRRIAVGAFAPQRHNPSRPRFASACGVLPLMTWLLESVSNLPVECPKGFRFHAKRCAYAADGGLRSASLVLDGVWDWRHRSRDNPVISHCSRVM